MSTLDTGRIVRIFDNPQAVAAAAAERIVELAHQAIAERKRFSLALSGGKTPEGVYRILAERFATTLNWNQVHLWWGDERCVPWTDPNSNARMVSESLLKSIPIPPQNVHRVPTDLPPDQAASKYGSELRRFDPITPLDLTLLGMGADGHTASLFPGSPALTEDTRWVVSAKAPSGAPVENRVTFTYPLLATSRHTLVLVTGSEKREVLRSVLEGNPAAKSVFPIAEVRNDPTCEWYVDAAASGAAE